MDGGYCENNVSCECQFRLKRAEMILGDRAIHLYNHSHLTRSNTRPPSPIRIRTTIHRKITNLNPIPPPYFYTLASARLSQPYPPPNKVSPSHPVHPRSPTSGPRRCEHSDRQYPPYDWSWKLTFARPTRHMTDPPELRGRHHMKRQATAVRRQAAVASLSQPRRSSYPVPPPCALHTSLLPRHIPLRLGLSHSKNVRSSDNTRNHLRDLRFVAQD